MSKKRDISYPLIKGILIINDKINPIKKLIDIIFISLYIIQSEPIKVIVYNIPLLSIYHIPILKHDTSITNIIILLIIIE